ncbi:MAG: hypothetical protein ACQEQE_05715 [Bacillota bacterium]
MKKSIAVVIILTVLIFMIGCNNDTIEDKENNTTSEVSHGEKKLSTEEFIEKLREINDKYKEDEYIEVDGYKISERKIEIAMLSGRSKKEAIQWTLKPIKKARAIREIASDLENVIPSVKKVNEYKESMIPSSRQLSKENLEIHLLTTGYSSYDEYLNSEKTFESVEIMLIEKNILDKLKKKEMDSNISDLEATKKAREKLDKLIDKEIKN